MGSLTESELLRLSDLNLVEYWCESSNWVPGTEILRSQDDVFINTTIDFPSCNLAFNLALEPDDNPEAFLDRVKDFYASRKPAFSLLLRGHSDQGLVDHCKHNKMFMVGETPGMVLEEPIEEETIPPGAELHWVDGEKELRNFAQVAAEAFRDLGFPESASQSYFANTQRVLSPFVVFAVVHFEGEPVSAAMALLSHGIAGIYWVATIKKTRGKGMARYCTREVGNAAFELGARKVVLQASRFGEPVYLKMGYRKFTTYPWFIYSRRR